ncbi:MAG: hypothetical protein DDG60_05755 [Anaerolineae bacterium]|nr:MAG: hypothetical protein DDG60_05755 [Anaerolineae bacterium]
MIVCPNCKHQESDGAIFCSECGMQLVQYTPGETQRFDTATGELQTVSAPQPVSQVPAWISLHLLESGQILPISDRMEFTMGRVSENQPIMPDIDLSPFKAFDNGVSRLHAVIRNNAGNIVIMDLGSSNGTYINGMRIVPNIEQPLRHGDIVALGKLKMQIVLS